jgi:hypothetical protein
MINKTNTNKDYCNSCDNWINQKEFNGSFCCELCRSENITTFYSAEDLINNIPTEEDTTEEVLSKVAKGKYKRSVRK